MTDLEVLMQALLRFQGFGVMLDATHGHAVFDTLEQASGFASGLEESFQVDDPEPWTCPRHDDEKGWRVEYVRS